jgi:hypothetical protein
LLLGVLNRLAIAELDALDELAEAAGAVESTPVALGRFGEFEDHSEGRLAGEAALGLGGPEPHGGEGAFDRIRAADVFPMFGGEVVEGEQRRPVLQQAVGGLVMLRPILVDEGVEGRFGDFPAFGLVDGRGGPSWPCPARTWAGH